MYAEETVNEWVCLSVLRYREFFFFFLEEGEINDILNVIFCDTGLGAL